MSRFGGDEFALLLVSSGFATHHEIAAHLRTRMSGLEFLPEGQNLSIPITVSVGVALFPDHGLDRLAVVNLADERLLRAKAGDDGEVKGEALALRTAILGSVEDFSLLDSLVIAVDNKDRYTRRHSEDVLEGSLRIAREMGLSEDEQQTIATAALIHDVGKIGVPDAVLRKPGRLTPQEFQTIKRHPQIGAAIISAVPGLEDTRDVVLYHHERWDGQGYPSGLAGEATPLLARVMAVADAFSAMTMDRPYRRGASPEEAASILKAGAGTQWDPACVAAFLRAQMKQDQTYETPETYHTSQGYQT
jgi:HD-GYP domain-containing protein (c-di-GMP phosphodiesterase class II)